MSYLVDSDWIIDALVGITSAVEALEQHAPEGLAVSVITVGEVFDGAYGAPDPQAHLQRSREFLSGFARIGLTDPVMERFAELRSTLRRQGNLIPDFDLLIASTALHHDLVLMTRNRRHFSRIPGLKLYERP